MTWEVNIQPGHLARNMPKGASAQGREAAVIDVAQDLLLANLQEKGILQSLSLKGELLSESFTPGKKAGSLLTLISRLRKLTPLSIKRLSPSLARLKSHPRALHLHNGETPWQMERLFFWSLYKKPIAFKQT